MSDEAQAEAKEAPFIATMGTVDPCSFSNPESIVIKAVHFDLTVSMEDKKVYGTARIDLEKLDPKCEVLYLDTKLLEIFEVKDSIKDEVLSYSLSQEVNPYGSCLKINVPPERSLVIIINYSTHPKSSALQWLTPSMTSGEFPFMFSQCQAIHARALYPCQDTPFVKFTYTADVTVQSELVALMSGLHTGEKLVEGGKKKIFSFAQHTVIPSYLVAIAVGRLESRRIGPRSSVWAEKEVVDRAAHEFTETEDFLRTAEELCGPYVWGVYDILVLPPSFPYGGMENPCLSFVTPTLLAGDRSLANVVAHEITHSWTGNLVTNITFEHFWLNEGFTVFIERKILGRLYGESFRQFHAVEGYLELKETISVMGAENPMTNLVVNLKGLDPDDAFSTVPYEKGHTFLFYLETLVGGPEAFEPFLKDYLNHFRYKSISSNDFKDFFVEYFTRKSVNIRQIDWDKWLNTPGMPLIQPNLDATLRTVCESLVSRWVDWSDVSNCPFSYQDLSTFSSLQKSVFLSLLVDSKPLPVWKLEAMNKFYGFGQSSNSELLFRWYRLCAKGHWLLQVDNILSFTVSQGRMKFIRPLYRDLYAWPEARDKTISNFLKFEDKMMYLSKYVVRKELGLPVTDLQSAE